MAKKFTLFPKAKVFANRVALRKSVVLLARVIIKIAQIHSFLESRKYAATWVRFFKGAALKRAVNY